MKKLIENMVIVVMLIFLATSIAGFILDRPVLVSYAYSESMTPTIDKGDLFFINPLSKTGDVGDIIVFHRRDGWTVHRVYAITDEGYITKGDNNVATDQQDGAYPPVTKNDIIGKVVTVQGHPLVIRGGGSFIEGLRSKVTNVYVVGALIIVGAILTFSGGAGRKHHKKSKKKFFRVSMRTVYAAVSVLIIAGFLFVTMASWGTLAFTYSSTLAGGQKDGWYLPGTTFEKNLSVENHAVYPFYYFIEPHSKRMELLNGDTFRIPGGESHSVLLRVSVPKETRIYREEIEVHSYPAILPLGIISRAYDVTPYLPLLLYSIELAVLMIAFYYLAGIGEGEIVRVRVRRGSIISKILGDGLL
ncbi:signal peptidase I [Thermococcus indicus]|uniref:Signal peptidase I n=1 Tax=Thermococcus indicus TaxID=2586643 RepID=A0A4Y5SL50_9EURY|nr:signal peptidase I [Thermococcus indicus]QDA30690.1 signal peptidase I [Thermococcus indicus]